MSVGVPLIRSKYCYFRLVQAVLYRLVFKCLEFKYLRYCLLGLARSIKTQLTLAAREVSVKPVSHVASTS